MHHAFLDVFPAHHYLQYSVQLAQKPGCSVYTALHEWLANATAFLILPQPHESNYPALGLFEHVISANLSADGLERPHYPRCASDRQPLIASGVKPKPVYKSHWFASEPPKVRWSLQRFEKAEEGREGGGYRREAR
jgi:hypothetical protein